MSLAAVLDGMNRTDAARIGGMNRQTLPDWVHRFNELGPDGLKDDWSKGNPPRLSPEQLADLSARVEAGPDRATDGVVRWRRVDLQRVIAERSGVVYHERTVGKLLHGLGFRRVSARPRHPAQDERLVAEYEKLPGDAEGAPGWFCPDANRSRSGFKTKPASARRTGSCASGPGVARAPSARRPALRERIPVWRHLPGPGHGAALATPYAETSAMQLHLEEISRTVARGAHAVLLLDRAGWHTTSKLDVPRNLTLIFLPTRGPELNPVEQVWQYLRQNWLPNRVFDTYEQIIDAACQARNRLLAQPKTITSIGLRDWAHIGHG
jgi:transposase